MVEQSPDGQPDAAPRRHLPDEFWSFFDDYLIGVAAPNVGIALRRVMDRRRLINAAVETADRARFTIGFFAGMTDALADVLDAIAAAPDSGAYDIFADLAERLGHKRMPTPLLLFGCQALALHFIAFHEFAHIRAGHFNMPRRGDRKPAASARLSIAETEETRFALRMAVDGTEESDCVVCKHVELEADLHALQLLIEVSDAFCADAPAPVTGIRPRDEVSLYAACLCLCLFEVVRKRRSGHSNYPRPFTRILAAYRQFVIATKGDWTLTGDDVEAPLSLAESERYATVLVNVVSLCNFCCEVTGHALDAAYRLESEADFLSDALSITSLVKDGTPLRTPDAQELAALDASARRYRQAMHPFRIQPWEAAS